jgi:hypothetical protein
MARSKALLHFQVISLFLFAGPALLSIFGSRVSVAADSVYLRRIHTEDHATPASLQARGFLGIDRIEPGLGAMTGFPGAIANLAMAIWNHKNATASNVGKPGNVLTPTAKPTTPSASVTDTGDGDVDDQPSSSSDDQLD